MRAHGKNRPKGTDGLLSVGDVARRLRVSVDVVRSLTESGQLKAARTGGRRPPEQFPTRLRCRRLEGRRRPYSVAQRSSVASATAVPASGANQRRGIGGASGPASLVAMSVATDP